MRIGIHTNKSGVVRAYWTNSYREQVDLLDVEIPIELREVVRAEIRDVNFDRRTMVCDLRAIVANLQLRYGNDAESTNA